METQSQIIDQLCLALAVYEEIERYERENGKLPNFCADSFLQWKKWRKAQGLED